MAQEAAAWFCTSFIFYFFSALPEAAALWRYCVLWNMRSVEGWKAAIQRHLCGHAAVVGTCPSLRQSWDVGNPRVVQVPLLQ